MTQNKNKNNSRNSADCYYQSSCQMNIFDLDDQKIVSNVCYLRIISDLTGMSQYSYGNSLYLCGSNNDENTNTTGSYFLRFDLEDDFKEPHILVTATFNHYKPMMMIINKDTILAIGGKKQVYCEKYSVSSCKWKNLGFLPEERYKGSLYFDQKNYHLYLFGGITNEKFNETILKFDLKNGGLWNNINVYINGNFKLLRRYNSISFSIKDDKDNENIYICGGVTEKKNEGDYIVEFDTDKCRIKKMNFKSPITSAVFDNQSIEHYENKYYVFKDSLNNIYSVNKENFKVRFLPQIDLMVV